MWHVLLLLLSKVQWGSRDHLLQYLFAKSQARACQVIVDWPGSEDRDRDTPPAVISRQLDGQDWLVSGDCNGPGLVFPHYPHNTHGHCLSERTDWSVSLYFVFPSWQERSSHRTDCRVQTAPAIAVCLIEDNIPCHSDTTFIRSLFQRRPLPGYWPLEQEPRRETVHWDGEESLSLGRVNVHCDHLVHTRHLQHAGYQLGCYRFSLLWLLVISSEGSDFIISLCKHLHPRLR